MRRAIVIGLIVVSAVIIATLGHQPRSSAARSLDGARPPLAPGALPPPAPSTESRPSPVATGRLTAADGLLTDGATVFDDRDPGIANLDPRLLQALRKAAKVAKGIEFDVTSGWRSAAYQDQLLREAVARYGSVKEAERWVATAETSPHVSGDAVDMGAEATAWLTKHGATYGLCRIYRNEPWHFELRPTAATRGCPRMYADPTHDPRMSP
jgi:zinc D-Ala-D-Ala carboxypeptidase